MIFPTLLMKIAPKNREAALTILTMTAAQYRIRPGCISCHIYNDLQEEGILLYQELWRCLEDMEDHLRSEEYRNLLIVLEMGVMEPEIRFDTISDTTGIETIERARRDSLRGD